MLQIGSFGVNDRAWLHFWHLPVTKEFTLPKYYIGQVVLHLMKKNCGEILHPVVVIGISWSGTSWEYGIEFPKDHPLFKPEEIEGDWVREWQLEAF